MITKDGLKDATRCTLGFIAVVALCVAGATGSMSAALLAVGAGTASLLLTSQFR